MEFNIPCCRVTIWITDLGGYMSKDIKKMLRHFKKIHKDLYSEWYDPSKKEWKDSYIKVSDIKEYLESLKEDNRVSEIPPPPREPLPPESRDLKEDGKLPPTPPKKPRPPKTRNLKPEYIFKLKNKYKNEYEA